MSAFKAQSMMQKLKEQLKLSVAGVSFVEGSDASFFPILLIAKGTSGTREAVLVKIEMVPDDAGHKDALDLTQRLYNPHKVTILREDAGGSEEPQQPDMREKITAECAKLGSKTEIWEDDEVRLITDPADYDLSGATKVAEFSPDNMKQNPLTNSQ
jgi:hypothetical protein